MENLDCVTSLELISLPCHISVIRSAFTLISANWVGEDGVISDPFFSSRIHLNLPPLPLHFRVRKTLRRMDSLEIVLNPMALCQFTK